MPRDESLGEKLSDLAVSVTERATETIDNARRDWEDKRRYDDDDDDAPVFRGNRNYEGPGVGVGEALVSAPVHERRRPRCTPPPTRPHPPPPLRRATWPRR